MEPSEPKDLPFITRMPIIKPEVLDMLRAERERAGRGYFWRVGAEFVRENPSQAEAYKDALRAEPPTTPDATSAAFLWVWQALEVQARMDGFRLPQMPKTVNPSPALRDFMRRSDGTDLHVINMAYDALLKINPVVGDIVREIQIGAPDELLRIMTETQAKRGAVYAYYGVEILISDSSDS